MPFVEPPKTIKKHKGSSSDLDSIDESDTESQTSGSRRARMVAPPLRRPSILLVAGRHHYGSFYLRMGAVGNCFWFCYNNNKVFKLFFCF